MDLHLTDEQAELLVAELDRQPSADQRQRDEKDVAPLAANARDQLTDREAEAMLLSKAGSRMVAVVRDCPERGNGCATALFFTPPKRCWTRGAPRPCENAAKVQMYKMESSVNITYDVNTNLC